MSYLAVDPPGPGDPILLSDEEVRDARNRPLSSDVSEGRLKVTSALFNARAAAVSLRSLAQYASDQSARRWMPDDEVGSESGRARNRATISTESGEFTGRFLTLPSPNGMERVQVFQGVEQRIATALNTGEFSQVDSAQREFSILLDESTPGRQRLSTDEPQTQAISPEGAILIVERHKGVVGPKSRS